MHKPREKAPPPPSQRPSKNWIQYPLSSRCHGTQKMCQEETNRPSNPPPPAHLCHLFVGGFGCMAFHRFLLRPRAGAAFSRAGLWGGSATPHGDLLMFSESHDLRPNITTFLGPTSPSFWAQLGRFPRKARASLSHLRCLNPR